jgi:hypothetical protein
VACARPVETGWALAAQSAAASVAARGAAMLGIRCRRCDRHRGLAMERLLAQSGPHVAVRHITQAEMGACPNRKVAQIQNRRGRRKHADPNQFVDEDGCTSGPDYDLKGAVLCFARTMSSSPALAAVLASDTCFPPGIAARPIRMKISDCKSAQNLFVVLRRLACRTRS